MRLRGNQYSCGSRPGLPYNLPMSLIIEACSAQHIGDRQEQQDRVAIYAHSRVKGTVLAVLADGMGGHTGGAMAAEQVLHSAEQNFESIMPGQNFGRETLRASIRDAHDGIKLSRYTSEQDPHSTACLLLVQAGRADWAHCGDSRIYRFRNGLRVSRTIDHSYVMDLVQKGFLTQAQAEQHPNKNVLVSCLGDDDQPRVETGEATPLVPGDCFLLCSDGIWSYFMDEELGRILKDYAPRQAAEVMINTARIRAQGRGDNCSLAIIRLREADRPPPLARGRR
jgi:PPM family protein phosphatase